MASDIILFSFHKKTTLASSFSQAGCQLSVNEDHGVDEESKGH